LRIKEEIKSLVHEETENELLLALIALTTIHLLEGYLAFN